MATLSLPGYTRGLCQKLWQLQQDGECCDAILVGSDGFISCHQVVLAASCPNFTGCQTFGKFELLNQYPLECLQKLVTLIYTGEVIVTQQSAPILHSALLVLQLHAAAGACEQLFTKTPPAPAPAPLSGFGVPDASIKPIEQSLSQDLVTNNLLQQEKVIKLEGNSQTNQFGTEDDFMTESGADTDEVSLIEDGQRKDEKAEKRPPTDGPIAPNLDVSTSNLSESDLIAGQSCDSTANNGMDKSGPDGPPRKKAKKRKRTKRNSLKSFESSLKSARSLLRKQLEELDFSEASEVEDEFGDPPPDGSQVTDIADLAPELEKLLCACGRVYTSKSTLARHHARCGRIKFQCHRCLWFFATEDEHSKHESRCHNIAHSRYRCKTCRKLFGDIDLLRVHHRSHLNNNTGKKRVKKNKKFQCEQCSMRFVEDKMRYQHMHAKHGLPFDKVPSNFVLFKCNDTSCDFQTLSRYLLLHHQAKHSDVKPFVCEVCGRSFKLKGRLDIHMKDHLRDGFYQCDECGHQFTSFILYKGHKKWHAKRNAKYLCDQCPFVSKEVKSLDTHKYQKHGVPYPEKRKKFQCEYCPFVCNLSQQFNAHVRRHTGDLPYQCDICGKRFVNVSACKSHAKLHSDVKEFVCPHPGCSYAGKTKSNIKMHLLSKHSDAKPYICGLCDFRAKLRGNLVLHLRNVHQLQVEVRARVKPLGQEDKNENKNARWAVIRNNVGMLKETILDDTNTDPTHMNPSPLLDPLKNHRMPQKKNRKLNEEHVKVEQAPQPQHAATLLHPPPVHPAPVAAPVTLAPPKLMQAPIMDKVQQYRITQYPLEGIGLHPMTNMRPLQVDNMGGHTLDTMMQSTDVQPHIMEAMRLRELECVASTASMTLPPTHGQAPILIESQAATTHQSMEPAQGHIFNTYMTLMDHHG